MKKDLKCPPIRIVWGSTLEEYFAAFTQCMRTTDILWTKPSELSFYCGLGIPIIMAPPHRQPGAATTRRGSWRSRPASRSRTPSTPTSGWLTS